MKLPSFKKIWKADYDEKYQDLITKLAYSINNAFESLSDLLNKKLTFSDNFYCTVVDVKVQVSDSLTGELKNTVKAALSTSNTVLGLIVIKVKNNTNSNIYPNSGIHVEYVQKNQTIEITRVMGLPADNNFTLSLVIF